ncbi:outer-membrane lipoprotein carrier protein LolA [Xanthobacter sp. VNH20]|uniref:outer-membrane lipoprotein carrier protein LolA n=1 Tax=Xanthobacter sp. VNH20 TaxID=3156616 RepID=UPI0032B50C7E
MPHRRPSPFAFVLAFGVAALAGAWQSGGAAAQGVLLPPGEVLRPGGTVPGTASQPSPSQIFAPQVAVPKPSAPAPQNLAPQTSAPAAPQASAAPANVPLPQQRPASANAAPGAPLQLGPGQNTARAGGPRAPQGPVAAPAQTNLDRADPATADKISAYWNSVQNLTGTFVQVDPDGTRKTGDFYMQKPGRVRFEYDSPVPIELISNGQSVAVRDRKLNTQDITPLSQTPLRFLLSERTDLARDPHVKGVYQDDLYISVVMEETIPMIGTYRLLILFDAKDYSLKQWIVTDPQGYDTSVALYKLDYTRRPDPKLFVINFERMLQ